MAVTVLIDQILRQAVAAGSVPGLVAMATDADGTLYEGAFGKRTAGVGPTMTLDTVFWIASMTKLVASVAALQLVEQGRLALDEPIGRVLLELEAPRVLTGWDADGAPLLRPARRPITLRHLLSHTAGFGYPTWNRDMQRYAQYVGQPDVAARRPDLPPAPLMFDPGERWEYGINIDWVGKAVEAVSGLDLDAYLREHVFAPPRMSDTGFVLEPSQRSRLIGRHARTGPTSFEFWLDPAKQVAGLMLTQILPFADRTVLDLFADFERTAYDSLAP